MLQIGRCVKYKLKCICTIESKSSVSQKKLSNHLYFYTDFKKVKKITSSKNYQVQIKLTIQKKGKVTSTKMSQLKNYQLKEIDHFKKLTSY